jgi:hypothetical protein
MDPSGKANMKISALHRRGDFSGEPKPDHGSDDTEQKGKQRAEDKGNTERWRETPYHRISLKRIYKKQSGNRNKDLVEELGSIGCPPGASAAA